jgi:hypothetical protein
VRSRLDRMGYVGLMLDDKGLLKGLPKEVDLKGSVNIIFIPTASLPVQSRSEGPI